MRNSSNIPATSQSSNTEQKTADKIYYEPARLKQYGGRFLYEPAHIPVEELESVTTKSSSYLYNADTTISFNTPKYEKEELIYDKRTGQWRLVPAKDMYKYES